MKKRFVALFLAFACVLLSTSAFAVGGPDMARSTAEQALKDYKGKLNGVEFNFANQEAFLNATLGESLPVFNFDVNQLSLGTDNLGSAMFDANLLEFIVKDNGSAVTRLTLKKDGDSYSRYQFGGLGNALTLGLSALSDKSPVDARLVYLGRSEFLYASLNGKEYLVSIGPLDLPGITKNRRYLAAEITPQLSAIATYMLQHPGERGGSGPGVITVSTVPPEPNENNTRTLWIAVAVLFAAMFGGGLFLRYRKSHV